MTDKRYNDGADVGEILVSSWGYDQTNVDFYKVTRRTQASVWIVKVGQKMVPGSEGFMSESVVVDPDNVLPWDWDEDREPRMKRVRVPEWANGEALVKVGYHTCARPYENRPMYQSHYA